MLTQFLPGFRELRGPLASGFLWLLLGWLILHDTVSEAQGKIAEVTQLGGDLGAFPLTAVASFGAYLIGSLSEDVFGRLLRLVVSNAEFIDAVSQADYSGASTMNESLREAQIERLENQSDRLRAEADLRVAIIPPMTAIVEYVAWFNNERLHESLGDVPPAEFEDLYVAQGVQLSNLS